MDQPEKCAWAEASQNQDIICVDSYSGYRGCAYDPRGNQTVLAADADDDALGIAVQHALAGSRFLSRKELPEFFDYRRVEERYDEWVKSLMAKQGYKTKAALFQGMKRCGIRLSKGMIKIVPMIHEELEAWGREKNDGIEDVIIRADRLPRQIGAALRLGFNRCVE
jgi:hypothetical protein